MSSRIANLFSAPPASTGQAELCERFWDDSSPQARALLRWLQASQELFPAFTGPLLRLLGAVSSGEHAQAAAAFLKSISQVCAAACAVELLMVLRCCLVATR